MEIKLKRTREKYWKWYNIYLFPTLRFSLTKDDIYKLDIIWLTFNLEFKYDTTTDN